MKIIKKIISSMMVLAVVLAFSGCATTAKTSTPAAKPTWSIAVTTAEGKKVQFTDLDFKKLTPVDIKATLTKKDGSSQVQAWTGVSFKKVIDSLGVKTYTSIVVTATDGYSQELTSVEVNDAGTILGDKLEGKALDTTAGPTELVVSSKPGSSWVKEVSAIVIKK